MKTITRSLFVVLILLTIFTLVLSACGPIDNGSGNPKGNNGDDKDKGNGNGNENDNNKGNSASPNKITICHKTGSDKNPYVEITVSKDATADGHASHEGDLIPAPKGGCPTEASN